MQGIREEGILGKRQNMPGEDRDAGQWGGRPWGGEAGCIEWT